MWRCAPGCCTQRLRRLIGSGLGDERVDDFEDVFLLAARQLGDGGKGLAGLAADGGIAARRGLPEHFVDGHAERAGDRQKQIGAGRLSAGLPIADVGGMFAELAGEFAQREAGGFAEAAQWREGFWHGRKIHRGRRKGLHVSNVSDTTGQCKSRLTPLPKKRPATPDFSELGATGPNETEPEFDFAATIAAGGFGSQPEASMNHENCGALASASASDETAAAEALRHLERDRWPEFERELWARRPCRYHFDLHHYGADPARWEWLVHRCRNWSEVERVLNRHRVPWEQGQREILIEGATIYRCR